MSELNSHQQAFAVKLKSQPLNELAVNWRGVVGGRNEGRKSSHIESNSS
jgi:hypothetical protein